MKKIAISACLLGEKCRYDGTSNKDMNLLEQLKEDILIPFCPEEYAFGSPRPTMDLVFGKDKVQAICNKTGQNLSQAVKEYANKFFDIHSDIDLIIGKDRSPSCGVCTAKLYDEVKNLISSEESGLFIKEAQKRHMPCVDAENYKDYK